MSKIRENLETAMNGDVDVAVATKAKAKPAKGVGPIAIPKLQTETFGIWIVGDSELIEHKWSRKAVRMMLGKQTGEANLGKENKNPTEDFLESLYVLKAGKLQGDFDELSEDGHPNVWLEGGRYAFPSVGFKAAMVEACTSLKKAITKVQARQCFHVLGELTEVFGKPRMRQDMVRLNGQTADIRFRGAFPQWAAKVNINFNACVLSSSQIVNLLNIAGYSVGVGEWRPSRDGSFGRFHVGTDAEVRKLGLK